MDIFNPRALLLLAPVMPAATGNGLAMRAGAQLVALSADYDVSVVVVPVSGGSLAAAWAERHAVSVGIVLPGTPLELRAGITQLLGNAAWRDRLSRSEPFPTAVTYAGPALAGAVAASAGGLRGARVHALRAYLAPLAVAVAERLEAPWATLDLDDDDEQLLESEGRGAEAQAYARILQTFGLDFAWLSLASREDADRVAARHGLPTAVVPNSVAVASAPTGRSRREAGRVSLLFVGNLTYGPNAEAAEALVCEVLRASGAWRGGPSTSSSSAATSRTAGWRRSPAARASRCAGRSRISRRRTLAQTSRWCRSSAARGRASSCSRRWRPVSPWSRRRSELPVSGPATAATC